MRLCTRLSVELVGHRGSSGFVAAVSRRIPTSPGRPYHPGRRRYLRTYQWTALRDGFPSKWVTQSIIFRRILTIDRSKRERERFQRFHKGGHVRSCGQSELNVRTILCNDAGIFTFRKLASWTNRVSLFSQSTRKSRILTRLLSKLLTLDDRVTRLVRSTNFGARLIARASIKGES